MNNAPAHLLSRFGFSEQEAEVYLVVLALGSASVTEIAKKVGKARNAIYFHIRNLKEDGLLSETRAGKRQRYVALSPTRLAERFAQLTAEFQSLVPQIATLSSAEKEIPIINIAESRKSYLNIYKEVSLLPDGSLFRVLEGKQALQHELVLLTQSEWRSFFTSLIQKKIKTRGLFTAECKHVPAQTLSKENAGLLAQREWGVKFVPKKMLAAQQLMCLYGDTVAFLFPDASLVVTIKHPGIVGVLSASFDALYHFAGKEGGW